MEVQQPKDDTSGMLITQIARIADALEESNKRSSEWIAMNIQWHEEAEAANKAAREIEQKRLEMERDWFEWQKRRIRENDENMMAIYEESLRRAEEDQDIQKQQDEAGQELAKRIRTDSDKIRTSVAREEATARNLMFVRNGNAPVVEQELSADPDDYPIV